MPWVAIAAGAALLISFWIDRKRTIEGLRISWKRFAKILPAFVEMLLILSIILYLIPDDLILRYLGERAGILGFPSALFFGSITMMPGFIAFPLAGILLDKGVSYMMLAAFTTSLMMVGVVTFPIEREYLGVRATVLRNLVGVLISIVVSLVVGIFYGELF